MIFKIVKVNYDAYLRSWVIHLEDNTIVYVGKQRPYQREGEYFKV